MREVPIRTLEPGSKFDLVMEATTGRRYTGTLLRKGPGTVAVVMDGHEEELAFKTQEGREVRIRRSGGVLYWSPGTPVIDRHEAADISRWTAKGGTGVGMDERWLARTDAQKAADEQINVRARMRQIEDERENSAMSKKIGLPGIGGKNGKKTAKAKTAKPKQPKELHECLCGCREMVAGRFRMGHDGRYYGLLKKVIAGKLQFNELPKKMQNDLGNVAGAKKALAAHG